MIYIYLFITTVTINFTAIRRGKFVRFGILGTLRMSLVLQDSRQSTRAYYRDSGTDYIQHRFKRRICIIVDVGQHVKIRGFESFSDAIFEFR